MLSANCFAYSLVTQIVCWLLSRLRCPAKVTHTLTHKATLCRSTLWMTSVSFCCTWVRLHPSHWRLCSWKRSWSSWLFSWVALAMWRIPFSDPALRRYEPVRVLWSQHWSFWSASCPHSCKHIGNVLQDRVKSYSGAQSSWFLSKTDSACCFVSSMSPINCNQWRNASSSSLAATHTCRHCSECSTELSYATSLTFIHAV